MGNEIDFIDWIENNDFSLSLQMISLSFFSTLLNTVPTSLRNVGETGGNDRKTEPQINDSDPSNEKLCLDGQRDFARAADYWLIGSDSNL